MTDLVTSLPYQHDAWLPGVVSADCCLIPLHDTNMILSYEFCWCADVWCWAWGTLMCWSVGIVLVCWRVVLLCWCWCVDVLMLWRLSSCIGVLVTVVDARVDEMQFEILIFSPGVKLQKMRSKFPYLSSLKRKYSWNRHTFPSPPHAQDGHKTEFKL
jgi:hypothetical protein